MKFVSYLRVSTARQGVSGLGLEAQRAAIASYVEREGALVGEFVEVETGKGADALTRRPELRAALTVCKKQGAILVVAKLDRLARNTHFVSGLIEAGVDFRALDMPNANKTMLQMFAVMAEYERDMISARTKAALAAARARGRRLGTPGNLRRNIQERQQAANATADRLRPVLAGMDALSLREKAARLNQIGIPAPKGGLWTHVQVARIEARARRDADPAGAIGQPSEASPPVHAR